MKKLILIGALLISSISTKAQVQGNDEKQIRDLLNWQTKQWNKGDIEGFMKGYWQSDSLVFIGKNGPKYGWKTTLENYKKSYPDKAAMGILKFDILKVETSCDKSAFVIGRWELTRMHDKPAGYYTLFLEKINNEWRIVADHSS
ncbi:YybH family protein [Solitalea koreensis]|uniref:DUF4440 domain-containing protein n=1 Tax=Solitalea koreensis TaxID=543615 RepID=A0A521AUP0_9SPHI|nr:nuclear transport factor 2 family protein [Solitalea koreensis]SMO38572.1 protein of unknown function [Solitalea koreensis]